MDDNAERALEAQTTITPITFEALVSRVCNAAKVSDIWDDSPFWEAYFKGNVKEMDDAPEGPAEPYDEESFLSAAIDAAQTVDNFLTEIGIAMLNPENPDVWCEKTTKPLEAYVPEKLEEVVNAASSVGYFQAKAEDWPQIEEGKRMAELNKEHQEKRFTRASAKRTAKAKLWQEPALEIAKQYRFPNGNLSTKQLSCVIHDADFWKTLCANGGIKKKPEIETVQGWVRKCVRENKLARILDMPNPMNQEK